ncbi:hypothetical protein GCM10023160_33590 [Brachybacterium paraconglomeratum]|uniref:serine/threonine-protein kinase n=1 Tax=Brachybacterium paraconglomeratum TaxID=173362 RepID=UPI0031F084FD
MNERPLGSSYLLSDERLGAGAMGVVHRGRDHQGRPFAIKSLRPEFTEDQLLVQKFVQERSALIGVTHPHVVVMHDLVVEGDTLAIIMELVEGHDLRAELAARGPLPPAEVSSIGGAVASGLAAVHAARLIHRDLKPENVLLDTADGRRVPKAADFGISRIADAAAATRSTVPMGTPNYSAPEIAEGKVPTGAADVYSLGIMLYELACGVTPFQGGSQLAVMRRHADDGVPRPEGIPEDLWRAIVDMTAKDPLARPTATQVGPYLTELGQRLAGQPSAPQLADPLPTVPLLPRPDTGPTAPLPADIATSPTIALASPTVQMTPVVTADQQTGPVPAPPGTVRQAAGQMAGQPTAAAPRGRARGLRRFFTVAAVLLVIGGAGGVFAYSQLRPGDEPDPAAGSSSPAGEGVAGDAEEEGTTKDLAGGAAAEVDDPAGESGDAPAEEPSSAAPTPSPTPTAEVVTVMPDLVGTSLSEAKLALPGTEISVVEQLDPESADNTILSQTIPAGEDLPGSIAVTVARQPVTVHLDTLEIADGDGFFPDLAHVDGDTYPRSIVSGGWYDDGFGEWNLGRGYREVAALVGRSDDATGAGETIQVDAYLDGRNVWSERVQVGNPAEMRIDVTGGLRLRIEFTSLDEERAHLVLGDIHLLGLPEEVPEPADG